MHGVTVNYHYYDFCDYSYFFSYYYYYCYYYVYYVYYYACNYLTTIDYGHRYYY